MPRQLPRPRGERRCRARWQLGVQFSVASPCPAACPGVDWRAVYAAFVGRRSPVAALTPVVPGRVRVLLVEVARMARVGRAAVVNWRRWHADFPVPAGGTEVHPQFDRPAVVAWLLAHDKIECRSACRRHVPGPHSGCGVAGAAPCGRAGAPFARPVVLGLVLTVGCTAAHSRTPPACLIGSSAPPRVADPQVAARVGGRGERRGRRQRASRRPAASRVQTAHTACGCWHP